MFLVVVLDMSVIYICQLKMVAECFCCMVLLHQLLESHRMDSNGSTMLTAVPKGLNAMGISVVLYSYRYMDSLPRGREEQS
jgi:predicted alpha/beta-hydrolase family hydrolase